MKLKTKDIYSKTSSSVYKSGINYYNNKKIMPKKITTDEFCGIVAGHYDNYYGYYLRFDKENNITAINCSCPYFDIHHFCKHVVAVCKLRDAYVNGQKIIYDDENLEEFVPYGKTAEEKESLDLAINRIKSLDRSEMDFYNQITFITEDFIKTNSEDNFETYLSELVDYLIEIKEEKFIPTLYAHVCKLNKYKYCYAFVNVIDEKDSVLPAFFSNLTYVDSGNVKSCLFDLLYRHQKCLAFTSEELLLEIIKNFREQDDFVVNIIDYALDLEYVDVIKFYISHCRMYFSTKQLELIVKILKKKVDPSEYYDLYKMRIIHSRLKPQEFAFLYEYLNKDQIEEILTARDDSYSSAYGSRSYLSSTFLDYFINPSRCDAQDMDIDEYYALKDVIFNRNDSLGKNAIKGFKKLVTREASNTSYHDEEKIFMMINIIILNISNPKLKEITMNEKFNNLINNSSAKLSSYYFIQLSKLGISPVGFNYSIFNK